MLRIFLTSLVVLMSTSYSYGQEVNRATSKWQNYLPIEGGGFYVKIDSTTSLDSLINRLSENWEFIKTGKLYWIGYTDDMFSIAARGDEAIQPLVKFLQNSKSENAKYGAIYCLHLIGINRTMVGRMSEEFVNPKARAALLQLLDDPSLQESIMRLLIRDPWLSDIPHIMKTIESCKTDCWALVNGLTRYRIDNLPIRQIIPDQIKNISVRLKYKNDSVHGENYDFDTQIKDALDAFMRLKSKYLSIEDTLFKSKLTGDFISIDESFITIGEFLRLLDLDYYTRLGTRLQYYMEDSKLYICSPNTARKRMIAWWSNQTQEQKDSYNKNYR